MILGRARLQPLYSIKPYAAEGPKLPPATVGRGTGSAAMTEDKPEGSVKVVGLPDVHSQAKMKAQREEEELIGKIIPDAQPGQPEKWAMGTNGHQVSSWGNIICSQCSSVHMGSAAFSDHLNGKKHKNAMLKLRVRDRQRIGDI